MAINEEMLAEWMAHPVTQALRAKHVRDRQEIMETWARGGFTQETEFKTAVIEAAAIRHCEVLQTLLDLTPEDFDDE